jgi:hypothetical protein
MSINESGKWWVGTDAADIGDYLRAYSEDNYQTSEFRLAKCSCGSEVFYLEADDDEGVAKRTCVKCGGSTISVIVVNIGLRLSPRGTSALSVAHSKPTWESVSRCMMTVRCDGCM